MNKNEIELIVKDTLEFVEEEMFATTAGERHDLAEFLRNRLAVQPSVEPDSLCWQCHHANGKHSLNCTVGNSTGGSR